MRLLRRLLNRSRAEHDMREEMLFHIEARTADLVRRGAPPDAAARQARLEFGSTENYREEARAALGFRLWDELRADIRYTARSLATRPAFHAAVVAILALAIGANAVFFTLYSHYALQPLPIRGADRHFWMFGRDGQGRTASGFTPAEIDALRTGAAREIEGVYTGGTFQVLVQAPVHRQTLVTLASPGYFPLLGAIPAMGRTPAADEERQPVAVLSHQGARQFFPGDPNPLGKTVRIRSTIFTVIGVLTPAFTGTVAATPDLWVPSAFRTDLRSPAASDDRHSVYGLVAPGVSTERAEAVLTSIAAGFPRPPAERITQMRLQFHSTLLPDEPELKIVAAVLFAVFWIVLFIACANLANLFLARAASRTHEIAMRLSLGASRARIIRQLLTESTVTALVGAVAGCLIGLAVVQRAQDWAWSLSGLTGIALLPLQPDWRVFLYSALLGIAAGIAFGLFPAIELTTPSLTASSKREASSFAGRIRPRRLRNLLLTGQVAASIVLLILSAVLIRTIGRLDAVDPGYNLDQIYDLRWDHPSAAALREVRQVPGVAAAAASERVPLYGPSWSSPVTVGNAVYQMRHNAVTPSYFATFDLPVEGRVFTDSEAATAAPVAILSRATAARLWPGASPLGRTFQLDHREKAPPTPYQVIGVAPDIVHAFLFQGPDPSAIYLPAPAGAQGMSNGIARITGNPRAALAAIRRICDRSTGCDPISLRQLSAMQRSPFQIAAGVSGVLGALALLLTAIGLYSVAAFAVIQRRREIGVHLALGARPGQIVRRILGEALACVLAGAAIGLPVSAALSKLAAGNILAIRTFDPAAYLAVPALLAAATAIACSIPARRAAGTDPVDALREG